MRKIFNLALVSMALFAIVSCSEQKSVNTKICDYLYGVEYDDYDFDLCVNVMKKFEPAAAGCSEVRNGNFVGRNLDWYINKEASAIIKINASDKRYASLGMIGCCTPFSEEFAASGEFGEPYAILPFFTVDGINENGLYIGVNVMPTGETSLNPENWESGKWGHGAAFTNPESDKTYCVTYLVRVVLDNAKSVADAKRIIEGINWYEPYGFPHEGETQAFHWLISDAESSLVLEFLDNKPYYNETTEITKPSYGNIMTNFTNKLMSEGIIQTNGIGYERWDTLAENFEAMEQSAEGMENLMKKVWYTNTYTAPAESENFFISEFASSNRPAATIYRNGCVWQDEAFLKSVQNSKDNFSDESQWHTAETTLWYTTHTSVYDLAAKELNVLVHEGLDGQEGFYNVKFDDHFNKPLAK